MPSFLSKQWLMCEKKFYNLLKLIRIPLALGVDSNLTSDFRL